MNLKLLFLCALLAQPVYAETLNLDIVYKAVGHAHAYWRLNDEGKTIKAEKEMAQAETILKSHIKPKRKMTFPEGCTFSYKGGYLPEFKVLCPGYERIGFDINVDDKRIQERLEDCSESCVGEFYFLKEKYNRNGLMFNVWHGEQDSIDLGLYIKFASVKQVPKPAESPTEQAPSGADTTTEQAH